MRNEQTPHPHANKRSGAQKDADMILIAGLALKGCTEQGITDALNTSRPYRLSRSQIHSDLSKLRKYWAEQAAADTNELLGSELEKLNQLERTSWTAFDKTGEAAWLTTVLKVIAQRVDLLGLNKPVVQKTEFRPEGMPTAVLVLPKKVYPDRNA